MGRFLGLGVVLLAVAGNRGPNGFFVRMEIALCGVRGTWDMFHRSPITGHRAQRLGELQLLLLGLDGSLQRFGAELRFFC